MDKPAIITFKRNFDLAERIREHIGGEILLYGDDVFEKTFKTHDAIIAIMQQELPLERSHLSWEINGATLECGC